MKTSRQTRNPVSSIATCLALLLAIATLSGCVVAAGNKTAPGSGQTLGQELIDLKKAHAAGVINETEYQQKRQAIMDRYQ